MYLTIASAPSLKGGPPPNAVIAITRALEIARARGEERRRGPARSVARHPNRDQGQHRHEAMPTTGGNPVFAAAAARNATVVDRLERAGAIISSRPTSTSWQ